MNRQRQSVSSSQLTSEQTTNICCHLCPGAWVATLGCVQKEVGVSVWVCCMWVRESERGRAGTCLISLSAGSSYRQLLPHLLPCWMGA